MSSAEPDLLGQLIGLIGAHGPAAYAVLFLGAFFETLIPFSLAVLGEVFFLAGAVAAGMGALDIGMVALVLYGGGLLGDNASYWIGRSIGPALFRRLGALPLVGRHFAPERFARGTAFFQRYGGAAVFLARLSGPLSWVMPALAGTFRLPYPVFLLFNTLGTLLGIGQFLVLGYFFGQHVETVLDWGAGKGPLVLLVLGLLLALVLWRRAGRQGAA